MAACTANGTEIEVGDKVQIVPGGMDVTNGLYATKGHWYGEGGPLWATVVLIDPNWYTGGFKGQPNTVTKVRCAGNDGYTIVWQVQPHHIADNIIKKNPKPAPQPKPEPEPAPEPEPPAPPDDLHISEYDWNTTDRKPYAIENDSDDWSKGTGTLGIGPGVTVVPDVSIDRTKEIRDLEYANIPIYNLEGDWRALNEVERKNIGNIGNFDGRDYPLFDDSVIYPRRVQFKTAWEQDWATMLNDVTKNIQNSQGFPIKSVDAVRDYLEADNKWNKSDRWNEWYTNEEGKRERLTRHNHPKMAQYDYQIIPGDERFNTVDDAGKVTKYGIPATLEDKLTQVRASFGIPVHGNNMIARAMKYYMYNRFKVPDTNLLHNKSVTYVFFTRPDLNLLNISGSPGKMTANEQTIHHTEAAMIWRRYPELFKLLTARKRCGDDNDFNMLLSNQVRSFDVKDEEIDVIEAGKSWGEYTMLYGDAYTGRNAGEFSCNFDETSDYSVINLLKLWITYIDNVSRGAWSPAYDLSKGTGIKTSGTTDSWVYDKTLDYAASCYVFKCGADGEEVLYWSKYYGVFPVNTGASALTWDNDQPIGQTPRLNIRFKYAYKRDMSPISLIEFNHCANITKDHGDYLPSFDVAHTNSYRPFVGSPFIEITLNTPQFATNTVKIDQALTQVRLKFKKYPDNSYDPKKSYWYDDKNLYASLAANGKLEEKAK